MSGRQITRMRDACWWCGGRQELAPCQVRNRETNEKRRVPLCRLCRDMREMRDWLRGHWKLNGVRAVRPGRRRAA